MESLLLAPQDILENWELTTSIISTHFPLLAICYDRKKKKTSLLLCKEENDIAQVARDYYSCSSTINWYARK